MQRSAVAAASRNQHQRAQGMVYASCLGSCASCAGCPGPVQAWQQQVQQHQVMQDCGDPVPVRVDANALWNMLSLISSLGKVEEVIRIKSLIHPTNTIIIVDQLLFTTS